MKPKGSMMFYEIRRESAVRGRGAELARWMDEFVIPMHEAAGMVVVGSFTDSDDEDAFVWIRKFGSTDERAEIVERVHQDPAFESEVVPRLKHLLAGEAVTVRLVPTAHSRLGTPRDSIEGFADGAIEFVEALGLPRADLLG